MTNQPLTPRSVSGLGDHTQSSAKRSAKPLAVLNLDQQTYARTQDCVQCGLCLPSCPTYLITGQEADSPRGRIRLIKGLADGRIEPTTALTNHLDLCLDCRGCETACPSGVVYHELIEQTRAQLTGDRAQARYRKSTIKRPRPADRFVHTFTHHILPYPQRLKLALLPTRILQRLGLWRPLLGLPLDRALPQQLVKMMRMVPPQDTSRCPPLFEHYRASGPARRRRATVALFTGCVGSVLFQRINHQTIRLLQHAGCDVVIPANQNCCGAIFHHSGHIAQARAMARANLDAFGPNSSQTPQIDYTVNAIAGCGAMLKQYAHVLRDEPTYADRANTFSNRVRDICELLVELEPRRPGLALPKAYGHVTYHDACHLAHAQHLSHPPRQILNWINGLELVPLPESELCCGAAGIYNLTQPRMAAKLGQRKVQHIQRTGARVCATGNAGCAMQISSEADRLEIDIELVHPVTLLYKAYFGPA